MKITPQDAELIALGHRQLFPGHKTVPVIRDGRIYGYRCNGTSGMDPCSVDWELVAVEDSA